MNFTRRDTLKTLGLISAAYGLTLPGQSRRAAAAGQPVLTVSTWGGVTEEGIRKFVQPEFEKLTGATLAFDIGGQGARYNKLLAQRANPPADVFFSTDEAVVSGLKAGILTPATRQNLGNLVDIEDWALTVKSGVGEGQVAGAPFTLISYVLGYNPSAVDPTPTSWANMWDPAYAGKLAFVAPTHSQMPAFVILAAELAGGSVDNVELRPAKLSVFWTDWAPLAKTNDVTLAAEFDYYLDAMKDQKYEIDYVLPKEGGIGVPEYVSIVEGTDNRELAEAFLNLMMDPRVQGAFAAATYQGPTNRKTEIPPELAARCACGPRIENLRFFDPEIFAANRPLWTERMNLEVVPQWGTR